MSVAWKEIAAVSRVQIRFGRVGWLSAASKWRTDDKEASAADSGVVGADDNACCEDEDEESGATELVAADRADGDEDDVSPAIGDFFSSLSFLASSSCFLALSLSLLSSSFCSCAMSSSSHSPCNSALRGWCRPNLSTSTVPSVPSPLVESSVVPSVERLGSGGERNVRRYANGCEGLVEVSEERKSASLKAECGCGAVAVGLRAVYEAEVEETVECDVSEGAVEAMAGNGRSEVK